VTTSWLAAAVRADPSRFPAAVVVQALPGPLLLRADPSPAFPVAEVLAIESGDPEVVACGLPGLRGAGSPLPASWGAMLATMPADCAARGFLDAIEHRLLSQRLAVDCARQLTNQPILLPCWRPWRVYQKVPQVRMLGF
jgi:predicted component of type VI protein secretion system